MMAIVKWSLSFSWLGVFLILLSPLVLLQRRSDLGGLMGVWPLAKVNSYSISLRGFLSEFICQSICPRVTVLNQNNILCGRHVPGASAWTHIFMSPFTSSLLNRSKTSQIPFIWYLEINAWKGIDISGLTAAKRVSAPSKMLVFLQWKERLSYWQKGVTTMMWWMGTHLTYITNHAKRDVP